MLKGLDPLLNGNAARAGNVMMSWWVHANFRPTPSPAKR
jgi:hypothetical protein